MSLPNRLISSPSMAGLLLSAVVLLVYVRTMIPGVGFIDSGELAAVACTLGIAHPTGYPLFTLVGWVFSRLPLPGGEILHLNLMAALFSAAGIFVFFRLMISLLRRFSRGGTETGGTGLLVSAACSALLLAFSETYWAQAVAVEVYSLHLLFVPLILLLFVRALYGVEGEEGGGGVADRSNRRRWMVFSLVVGLSFTNHMTTILLAVGLLYLYFPPLGAPGSFGFIVPSIKLTRAHVLTLGAMVLPFLLGLSLYLYLPVRAARMPTFNWGDPVTVDSFFSHIGGKQYTVWIFSSAETAWRQLGYFLTTLGSEFGYTGVLFALIGLPSLYRVDKRFCIASVLLFLTCVGYAINYDIHDIDSYFLLAYVVVALWAGFGIARALLWMHRHRWKKQLSLGIVVALSLAPLVFHVSDLDQSANHLVDDYTHNMFRSLEPDALVLSYQWDYWVSASYYYQTVEALRPDVTVVDKELLRRSWYLKELEQRVPWLIKRSRSEVDLFSRELARFEHGLPYDPELIQRRFEEMILSFFHHNGDRPLYVTAEIEPGLTRGYERVPSGLAFRVVEPGPFRPTEMPDFSYRPFAGEGDMETRIRRLFSDAFKFRGIYYSRVGGDQEEAKKCWKKALEIDPTSGDAKMLLERPGPGGQ